MKKRGINKKEFKLLGHHIFSLGLVLVLFFTLYNPTRLTSGAGTILLLLGVVVGLFDIPKERGHNFILAIIGIMIVSGVVNFLAIAYPIGSATIGIYIKALLGNLSVFLSSAVVILALKVIYRNYLVGK
ncbi:MAG: hypothetical protein ABIB47_00900 [Candidatus Woesearchaeota archaeon]